MTPSALLILLVFLASQLEGCICVSQVELQRQTPESVSQPPTVSDSSDSTAENSAHEESMTSLERLFAFAKTPLGGRLQSRGRSPSEHKSFSEVLAEKERAGRKRVPARSHEMRRLVGEERAQRLVSMGKVASMEQARALVAQRDQKHRDTVARNSRRNYWQNKEDIENAEKIIEKVKQLQDASQEIPENLREDYDEAQWILQKNRERMEMHRSACRRYYWRNRVKQLKFPIPDLTVSQNSGESSRMRAIQKYREKRRAREEERKKQTPEDKTSVL